MLRQFIIFNAFSVFLVASITIVKPGPKYPPTKGEVWPKPQEQIKYETYYKLHPSVFKFVETGHTCPILTSAIERYSNVLRSTHHIAWRHSRRLEETGTVHNITDRNYKGTIEELKINLNVPCEDLPYLNMEEGYTLNVSHVSKLKSDSIWGILRGMETFAQLFYISDDYREVFINTTSIQDFPRYPHRGLLIDTSRHYITVNNILKTLDAMEMNKMNVLHWHIVDDQSFPYESEKFPQLSEKGAYHSSMIYTATNINQIVNYAKDRGIRVLPEFDVPGHTASWGSVYPNVLTKCYVNDEVVGLGPMDPTINVTYKLIGELFDEVQKRFPESYFHVGGDEVDLNCWKSNRDIRAFMTEHNMTKVSQLHGYFMNLVIPLLGPNTKPIVWQEVFDEGVPLTSDAIVQVWKNVEAEEMISILNAGHKLIYSSSWYLDQLKSGGDWEKFYFDDPRQIVGDYPNVDKNNIVGGEACMWGESVDDTNILTRVWPRASAVAEKLWSAETPRYSYFYRYVANEVFYRLEEHYCRMNRRGVKAQPPNGPGFCVTG